MPVDAQGRTIDESFEPTTGLADDFDATIVDAQFGTLEGYTDQQGNPQILAILRLGDASDDLGEFDRVSFSVGRGWKQDLKNPRLLVRDDDRPPKFNKNSMYYRLLERGMQLYPDLPFRASGKAYNLDLWIGTRWHWRREKIEFGPKIEAREHLMPTAFVADLGTAAAKAGSTSAAATPNAAPNSAPNTTPSAEAGDNYLLELQALAIQCDTHQEFLSSVLKNKSLASAVKQAGILASIMDKSERGFWALARQG